MANLKTDTNLQQALDVVGRLKVSPDGTGITKFDIWVVTDLTAAGTWAKSTESPDIPPQRVVTLTGVRCTVGDEILVAKIGGRWFILGALSTSITEDPDSITVESVNGKIGAVVLDADDISDTSTLKKFTNAVDKEKLDGIEAGAQVNVSPDWDATSGDAEILNKPLTFDPSPHTHDITELEASGTPGGTTYLRGDGTWSTPPNTNTTYSEITTAEITAGTATTLRTITGRRVQEIVNKSRSGLALASSISLVGTSGSYSDLLNKPVLGTAAAKDVGEFATAVQGGKADTAVQPAGIANFETSTQLNSRDTANRNRSNHTGTQTVSTISNFATEVNSLISSQKGATNGLAMLGADGKVPSSQLPALALTDVYVVGSLTEQNALVAQEGDIAIRTDVEQTYIHNGGTSGTITDWSEMLSPTADVTSVNGKTGAVSLNTSDIPEGTRLYYTDARVTANATVNANTANRHSHSNKSILDAVTAAFTTAMNTKLSGIAPGAEVNVQSDWNAVSGDALILNKPNIPVVPPSIVESVTAGANITVDNTDPANPVISTAGAAAAVTSVNGETGAVTIDQGDVADTTTYKRMTAAERTKLSGIATGAEVNVQSDWNATSGDALILNKPDVTTIGRIQNQSNTVGLNDVNAIIVQPGLDLTPDAGFVYIGPDFGDTNGGDLGTSTELARRDHIHDERYYTQSEVDTLLAAAKADDPISFAGNAAYQTTTALGSYVWVSAGSITVPAGTYKVTATCTTPMKRNVSTGEMWTRMRIGGVQSTEYGVAMSIVGAAGTWFPVGASMQEVTITTSGTVTLEIGFRAGTSGAGTTYLYQATLQGTLTKV